MAGAVDTIGIVLSEADPYGWASATRLGDDGCRLSRGDEALYVSVNRHWLCFSVPVGDHLQTQSAYHNSLLERCRRWFMCKYSLDETGQLLLQLEAPLEGLERSDCRKAIEAVSTYAGIHRNEAAREAGGDRWMLATRDTGAVAAGERAGTSEAEMLSEENAIAHFGSVEHMGWRLKEHIATNHWHAVYHGCERPFDTFIGFNRWWACFQIPLLASPPDPTCMSPECRDLLHAYLLQLNEQMYWAKLALDDDEQVLLMLEIPMEWFDLKRFRWGLQTLAAYAAGVSYEVQMIAGLDRDPHMASLLDLKGEKGMQR